MIIIITTITTTTNSNTNHEGKNISLIRQMIPVGLDWSSELLDPCRCLSEITWWPRSHLGRACFKEAPIKLRNAKHSNFKVRSFTVEGGMRQTEAVQRKGLLQTRSKFGSEAEFCPATKSANAPKCTTRAGMWARDPVKSKTYLYPAPPLLAVSATQTQIPPSPIGCRQHAQGLKSE